MESFRDFQIGPDPFGSKWRVYFKYLQTGISIRHSDSVDVCFILDNGAEKLRRVVVIPHANLREYAARTGRKISDTMCSRIAALKLRRTIENAEDIEKEYLPVSDREIAEFDSTAQAVEDQWVKTHAG